MKKEREYIPLEQAVQELCDMFGLQKEADGSYGRREDGAMSAMNNNVFAISSWHVTYGKLKRMLNEYFGKYQIRGYCCEVFPAFFGINRFEIKPVFPEEGEK